MFIMQVREATTFFRRGWERLENASQMDEEKLSEIKLVMDHLGSCLGQGYCCVAMPIV